VFNDASLQSGETLPSLIVARSWMAQLIATIVSAASNGTNRVLRTPSEFDNLELAADYTISKWRYDNAVQKEQRQYLGALAQKAPYTADIDLPDDYQAIEVQFENIALESFRIAYALDWLLVSVFSGSKWDAHQLPAVLLQYTEENKIEKLAIRLNHACKEDHIYHLCDWLVKRLVREEETGLDIWNHRKTLFPDIDFAPSVENHVVTLNLTSPQFKQIIDRLTRLNCYCRNWESGAFDISSLPHCTVETPTTLKQNKSVREFYSAAGDKLVLNLHLRYTPGPGRIYFDILPGQHSVCIGHIGNKLPQ